ncbi:hypothetical protein J7376_06615 [Paracoccus sp. R12_1]|jgi:predicted DNA-binding transcriptional regulator AlpA|uniref:hypothetical protein n=1 Tax=unclassified Paracoccus (in: a-proteobacteria) TaxID=2688777 RepID=UPI001ADAAFF4|nr:MULTISPECIES: hypothetical protein [unclassified Paracoccus (in: a-proteobacteria)]MBO9455518.1 hypothetical protein [Paracoccus sp. R12_2]MBO9486188.1 hypothetical protein [Paracoccus sp. R12_1]MCK5887354.1 hypothetical protein [Alcanivorax sp.]
MGQVQPLFASASTAAKLLDMKQSEFQRLVDSGCLPRGREIAPGMVRWPVDDLRKIVSGEAVDGGIDW